MPVSVLSQAPLPKITRASASSNSLMSLGGLVTTFSTVFTPGKLVACSSCQASSVRSRSYSCRPGMPCSFGPAQKTIFLTGAAPCALALSRSADKAAAPSRTATARVTRLVIFQKLCILSLPLRVHFRRCTAMHPKTLGSKSEESNNRSPRWTFKWGERPDYVSGVPSSSTLSSAVLQTGLREPTLARRATNLRRTNGGYDAAQVHGGVGAERGERHGRRPSRGRRGGLRRAVASRAGSHQGTRRFWQRHRRCGPAGERLQRSRGARDPIA